MIDPRNPALKSSASHWASPPVERPARAGRNRSIRMLQASRELTIDRVALTRFAVVQSFFLILYLVVGAPTDGDEWGFVNLIGPSSLCAAGLWAGYKIVATNSRTIWTPIPWFFLSTSVYFGFGPLLYLFGNAEILASMNDFWPVGPYDLWRTNLLNTVSILSAVLAYLAMDTLLGSVWGSDGAVLATAADDDDSARSALFVFLGLGLPLRYLLVLPATFGQLNFVLPGSLAALNSLVKLAVFMLAYLGAKRHGPWKFGFWLLFFSEIITNFLCFSKLEVVLVCIMAVLGRFMARRNVREFAISGVAIFAFFVFLSSLVAWCRVRLVSETGNLSVGSLELRLQIALEGLEQRFVGSLETPGSNEQDSWARVCYTPAQTAGMHLYDTGNEGDSFMIAMYNWIPRFIWPDKPIVTLGEDFTFLIQGRRGSCTAPGAFGEAYWNGGWLLVIPSCLYLGVVFAWLSRTALRVIANGEWVFLPCAFLGMMMGLRIDDWFAPTYVTTFILYQVYYLAVRFLMGFSQKQD